MSFRPDLYKKIQKKFILKYASKFISKSTLKSMFKSTTYSKFKSTVYRVVSVFTSTTVSTLKITVLRIISVILVFCAQVAWIFVFLGRCQLSSFKFYFKNNCLSGVHSNIIGMKMCDLQCTVAILVFISYSHTFVWGNDKLICCVLCVGTVTNFSVITWLWCSSTDFIL